MSDYIEYEYFEELMKEAINKLSKVYSIGTDMRYQGVNLSLLEGLAKNIENVTYWIQSTSECS